MYTSTAYFWYISEKKKQDTDSFVSYTIYYNRQKKLSRLNFIVNKTTRLLLQPTYSITNKIDCVVNELLGLPKRLFMLSYSRNPPKRNCVYISG